MEDNHQQSNQVEFIPWHGLISWNSQHHLTSLQDDDLHQHSTCQLARGGGLKNASCKSINS